MGSLGTFIEDPACGLRHRVSICPGVAVRGTCVVQTESSSGDQPLPNEGPAAALCPDLELHHTKVTWSPFREPIWRGPPDR